MEIRHNKREFQRKLELDKGFADALRDYAVRRWPCGTAKLAAMEWNLSPDEGRAVALGRASKTTVEKCIKRAGLLVGILMLEEVTGEKLADLFHDLRGVHDQHAQRIGALVGDIFAIPAPRNPDPADPDPALADRPGAGRRRAG